LFQAQFDSEHMTQTAVTYWYAVGNLAYLVSTLLAGIQATWLCYGECFVLVCTGLACLSLQGSNIREPDRSADSFGISKLSRKELLRVRGYVALCGFTLAFFTVFLSYLGGAFMIFTRDRIGPLGKFVVPSSWYLSLNGLVDLLLGVGLAEVYDRAGGVRYHVKLRISLLLLTVASGMLTLASWVSPTRPLSPIFPAIAIVLVSLGELHYVPVMLASISSELPHSVVGLCTGVFFLIAGLGGLLAGFGVSVYRSLGSTAYFAILGALSLLGAGGLQTLLPFLRRCGTASDATSMHACSA